MSEVLSISCISCRRKKIKCNKVKPCIQCEKRQISCNFPSTFRNIRVDLKELKTLCYNASTEKKEGKSSDFDLEGGQWPGLQSSRKMLETLKADIPSLAGEHLKLKNKYQDLLKRFTMYCETNNCSDELPESFKEKNTMRVNRETTELGAKYYGPLSSRYILKKMDVDNKNDEKMDGNKTKRTYSPQQHPTSRDLAQSPTRSTSESYQRLIKKSLLKKPLPYLLDLDAIIGPRNHLNTKLEELNFNIICKLVDFFFSYHPVYKTFISKLQIVDFLNNYDNMNDNEWENDDDLLLLTMILLLLIQRITAKELVEIDLLDNDDRQVSEFEKIKLHLSDILHYNFETIRHSLINEAVTTIQSYILCTEWHIIEQRYEECWSMMFHTCSIAYSIGLHVMGKFSLLDEQPLKEKDEDITRYKVWFALKNISGQICSVLGRPNPISIHVNSQILKVSDPGHSKQDLKKCRILIALKIGLSECLKLSNMMLIENFMTHFTIRDLLELDTKFKREIDLIKWFINDTLYDNDNLVDDRNIDSMDEDPNYMENDEATLIVDKTNLLVDLITFYINRAKLFQPFIVEFENPNDTALVVRLLHDSINKYLDCTIYFINSFLKQFGEKYKQHEFEYLKTPNFGKLLRVHFPFLNSFIYQGMLVIFTFLHYKFKDFVEYDESANSEDINYSEFLNKLDESLNTLQKLVSNFGKMTSYNNKLWSSNITHLTRVNLEHIGKIRHKQNAKIELDRQKFESDLDELQSQINLGHIPESELEGFNLRDPFWITNPDNLPYHLGSPSDDDNLPTSSFKENSRNTGPDPNKPAFPDNPEQPKHPQPQHSSQVAPNMLIDDFNPQTDAPYDDFWSNNSSYPSKSTSALSQYPQLYMPSVQQPDPTMSDFYDLPQQPLNFSYLPNLSSNNSSQMLGTLNDTNYPTQLQRFSNDDSQQKNSGNDESEVFNPDAF